MTTETIVVTSETIVIAILALQIVVLVAVLVWRLNHVADIKRRLKNLHRYVEIVEAEVKRLTTLHSIFYDKEHPPVHKPAPAPPTVKERLTVESPLPAHDPAPAPPDTGPADAP